LDNPSGDAIVGQRQATSQVSFLNHFISVAEAYQVMNSIDKHLFYNFVLDAGRVFG
jgi:hypothetical protein